MVQDYKQRGAGNFFSREQNFKRKAASLNSGIKVLSRTSRKKFGGNVFCLNFIDVNSDGFNRVQTDQ